tara:strand:- start:281 stop:460 length:180 start_codon:yes stop_codon:yes gene_type:complete
MLKWKSVKYSTLATLKQKHVTDSTADRFYKLREPFPAGWSVHQQGFASDEVFKNTTAAR